MDCPSHLKYTKDHEWVHVDGDIGIVGITAYAQNQLGDIVLVELPAVGDTLDKGAAFGVVESVKTVSDLYAPIAGTVTEINDTLSGKPEQVNSSPYDSGWMVKLKIANRADLDSLMDGAAYRAYLEAEGL